MRLLFITIVCFFFLFNCSFSQELKRTLYRFSWFGNKSGEYVTLNRDSTAYRHDWGCLTSAFKFGSWSQRGDTIIVRTYKYLEADTSSLFLNPDTIPLVRMHDGQLVVSIMDCSGVPAPNFILKFHNFRGHRKRLKTSNKGEVKIPLTKFSGIIGPYNLTKFLSFGIKDISIILCQEDESSPLKLNPEIDIQTFIKTEKGLEQIGSRRLYKKDRS